MEGIMNFAKDYYIVFIIFGVIFVFALIGYFAEKRKNKNIPAEETVQSQDSLSAENSVLTEELMDDTPTPPVQQNPQKPAPQAAQTQPQAPMEKSNEEEVPQINGLEG